MVRVRRRGQGGWVRGAPLKPSSRREWAAPGSADVGPARLRGAQPGRTVDGGDYLTVQAAPFRVAAVGLVLVPVQLPLKPKDVLAPAASVPL